MRHLIQTISSFYIDIWAKALSKRITVTADQKRIDAPATDANAESNDQIVFLETSKLGKGWYFLGFESNTAKLKTAVLQPSGQKQPQKIQIPLRPHRNHYAFFYLEDATTGFHLTTPSNDDDFSISNPKLIRLPSFYAHYKLIKALKSHTQFFNELSPLAIIKEIKALAEIKEQNYREALIEEYTSTLELPDNEPDYTTWLYRNEHLRLKRYLVQNNAKTEADVGFSIITVINNQTNSQYLKECIESLAAQTHQKWQLHLIAQDDLSDELNELINKQLGLVKQVTLHKPTDSISKAEAMNLGLSEVSHPHVMFLDPDDTLPIHALTLFAINVKQKPDAILHYSDEDRINNKGERSAPHFKPDWNPDLFYSNNYIGNAVVYDTEHIKILDGVKAGYEGNESYDLLLRATQELTEDRINHIPWVLYHQRLTSFSREETLYAKDDRTETGIQALQDYFDDQKSGVIVKKGPYPNTHHCQWPLPAKPPLVSLLIPTKDHHDLLKQCVDSILEKTTYSNYEIIILDNQTTCPNAKALIEDYKQYTKIRVYEWNKPFNYSAINNWGATKANGEVIGLINNDIEVITPDWLTEMVRHAIREDIGCVGAKLLYGDNTIQHAGVLIGKNGGAVHAYKYLDRNSATDYGRIQLTQNHYAVTGAALFLKSITFNSVGQFNEIDFPISYNDIDLCLKCRTRWVRNIYTPTALLYHLESKSRGRDITIEQIKRSENELRRFNTSWCFIQK